MFGILRVLMGFLIGFVVYLFVSKFIKTRYKIWFSIIVAILLITLLGFVPFENLVYSFKSAEDVYEYYYFLEEEAELVIEGDQSDFVVGRKNEVSTFLIVPKTADGWKIGLGLKTKRIVDKFFNGITVHVFQYKDTNDYFITVFDINGGELNISDNYNTEFFSLKDNNGFLGKPFVTYFAHISNFNQKYSVIVNGSKIAVTEKTVKTGDGTMSSI